MRRTDCNQSTKAVFSSVMLLAACSHFSELFWCALRVQDSCKWKAVTTFVTVSDCLGSQARLHRSSCALGWRTCKHQHALRQAPGLENTLNVRVCRAGEAAAQQLRGQLHARDCDAAALRARAEGAEQAHAAAEHMLQVRNEFQ